MYINDLINSSFEIVGAILCWLNFFKLLKDKEVKGVCWSVTAFFAIYGVWSLIYYYSLCQQLSFVAGIFLTSGNLAWTILAIKYKK